MVYIFSNFVLRLIVWRLSRQKKDKKESTAGGGKGLTKAGSAASLSRPVNPPRVPQHSYSMSRNQPQHPLRTFSSKITPPLPTKFIKFF